MSNRSDNIKTVKKNKEKYGKIKNNFLWDFIFCFGFGYRSKKSYIFLKVLKLPINLYICPPDRIILRRLKKNMEKYEKIEIFVFCRHVWISVESCQIFLKVLKLPIHSYLCPPDRIILSWLIKIKKNMEKSKFLFLSPCLDIGQK